jgi:transcriptional regulator with XRE-family HTH domain
MRTTGGLSQTDLGRELGFDRSSIANMERGMHTVSLADLMRAAEACGFSLTLSATRR